MHEKYCYYYNYNNTFFWCVCCPVLRLHVHVLKPLNNKHLACLHSLIKHALFFYHTWTLSFWLHCKRTEIKNQYANQLFFSQWFACVKPYKEIMWKVHALKLIKQTIFFIDIYIFIYICFFFFKWMEVIVQLCACAPPLLLMRNQLCLKKNK